MDHMQFPQGYMPTKSIAKRCAFCKKYPHNVTMRVHLETCDKNPENIEDD